MTNGDVRLSNNSLSDVPICHTSPNVTYYTYDSVGNITYKTFAYAQDADITINYDGTVHDFSGYTGISHYQYNTYDAANKLTYKYDEMWYTDTTEWLDNCMIYDYSYTYDTNGNMTKQVADITRNYTYNHINQLVQYSDPNDTVNYIYYPNGLREEKYSANYDSYNYEGLYVIYYYDKDGRIISEGKDAVCWELTTAVNIWGLNGLAKRTTYETTEIEYLSSATEYPITNYRGDILSNFENYINYYDAYGNERRETVSDNPFGYCGEYTDEESGLIYLRGRYYDPTVGRFISEDTHWNAENSIYGDEQKIENVIAVKDGFAPLSYKINKFSVEMNDENTLTINENLLGMINLSLRDNSVLTDELNTTYDAYSAFEVIKKPNFEAVMQSSNLYMYCMGNPMKFMDFDGKSATALLVATAPYWIPVVAGVVTGAIVYFKEHSKGARPSTKGKHQEGQARRQRDAGGEKGDARRTPRKDKKK